MDVVVGAVVVVAPLSVGGIAGQEGMRPMLASVLTDATNVAGAAGSGRASHGARVPTRIRNSGAERVTVAVNSNRQFHCSPPADMSCQRLLAIDPLPISVLATASRMTTGAPTARPAVEPPRESAHPTHVPSANRTASENGSVPGNGGPLASTPPALPAMATPVTAFGTVVDVVDVVSVARVATDELVVVDDSSSVVAGIDDVLVGVVGRSIGCVSRLLEQATSSTAPQTIISPRPTRPPSRSASRAVSQTRSGSRFGPPCRARYRCETRACETSAAIRSALIALAAVAPAAAATTTPAITSVTLPAAQTPGISVAPVGPVGNAWSSSNPAAGRSPSEVRTSLRATSS